MNCSEDDVAKKSLTQVSNVGFACAARRRRVDPGWLRTDLGGPQAPGAVESVLPGALVPVLLDDGTSGKWFSAQEYAES